MIEAVRTGSSVECWGRVQDDLELSVPFIETGPVIEGAFAQELQSRSGRRGRGARGLPPGLSPLMEPAAAGGVPETFFNNARFREQLLTLGDRLAGDAATFYKDGIRLAPGKTPRCVMGLYRRGLSYITENLL